MIFVIFGIHGANSTIFQQNLIWYQISNIIVVCDSIGCPNSMRIFDIRLESKLTLNLWHRTIKSAVPSHRHINISVCTTGISFAPCSNIHLSAPSCIRPSLFGDCVWLNSFMGFCLKVEQSDLCNFYTYFNWCECTTANDQQGVINHKRRIE